MSQVPIDDKVQEVLKHLLSAEVLEEAFNGYAVHQEETTESKKESSQEYVKNFWTTLPPESHEQAVQSFVTALHAQTNSKRVQLLFTVLEGLVQDNVVPARLVCDALLNNERLSPSVSEKWCHTFYLVRKIIGGVDYKGCRDLLRVVLEKAQSIPASDNVIMLRLINAVYEVVSYILDRNACLLPSYFAVNEITKLCSEDKPAPHWRLGELLSRFVQTFRKAAQMVTVSGRASLLPIVGHSSTVTNAWKLNASTLRFALSGPLPYDKDLFDSQAGLLRYVLEQPYSRDMVCNMLSLNKQVKQRCLVLEDQLVDLLLIAMERSEECDVDGEQDGSNSLLWQHLSIQLIFFVLFQFASFPHIVEALYKKLDGKNLHKGRDYLMWVLLQFISGSIQKNALQDFLPVLQLYDLLYPEKEVLQVPDVSSASSTQKLAITCIWIHLSKKAESEKDKLQRPMPRALHLHLAFLKGALNKQNINMSDYKIALLCNAYSTNPELFSLPIAALVESIYGNQQNHTLLPGGVVAFAPTQPLSMSLLDSLTVHTKMSLIHSIVTKVIRLAPSKANLSLAPALVETYSRLLVYMEIESLGIKGFISQLLPNVFKNNAWGILHTLLEMLSYRLHHIQAHYRVQLLSHLHTLSTVSQTNKNQLQLCIESTALRLIMGLGSCEVQPQLSRVFSEPKLLFSNESEELNRALILTMARALHVTGSETVGGPWCRDILHTIMQHTPHGWSSHTMACFPSAIRNFFQNSTVQREDKNELKRNVETEYRKWKSMASESDLITHFSMQGTQPLFLCVLWRSLLEDNRISPMAYKVLERLGPRALATHLRTFAEYLVYEFSISGAGHHVNKCVESLNDLIWKCSVVPIDRLVLCLVLRNLEGNEAQVCLFIIQLLLLKTSDFRNRVHEFVKENSPEHWLQNNCHEKHIAFHMKYPEKFFYEGLQDVSGQQTQQYLPIYFGNVCLRFLPVFDIVIHRFLELPPVAKSLETLLDHLGGLYKFHDRPLTYLYNTLHYYDKKLREKPALKKKVVSAIIGSQKDIRPAKWCLTNDYQTYLQRKPEDTAWVPETEYYIKLIGRLVDTIAGNNPFPICDWRFNEFPNPASHALHATCIELMALPVSNETVSTALLDVVLKGAVQLPRENIMSWMNALGLVLTALPQDGYWMVLHDRILETLESSALTSMVPECDPFQIFNFNACYQVMGEQPSTYVLALCHSVWQHASIGQLSALPQFLREKLKPLVKTEKQYLFICHMVGPFLQRFHAERTRCLQELTVELYEMLELVDQNVEHLQYMDPISDFLYHIKYMFVGDGVKAEVEKVIQNLHPPLKMRLRFISYHSKETTPA